MHDIPFTKEQADAMGTLALASVGDCVYDLLARVRLCAMGVTRAQDLHSRRVEIVNARTQARAARLIEGQLSDDERAVFRRGRNAQTGTIPQAATRAEYQAATALEALFGYLYLLGKQERLTELFDEINNNA